MTYVKWLFIITFWTVVVGFLHYTLPQHDVVRITGTYEDRIDVSENAWAWAADPTPNASGSSERLVFFIQARDADDRIRVYRNEDTGWGWPPFFKFDTANLHAEAQSEVSTKESPTWFAVKHYGWRIEFISIFPNAISIREVAGPDVRIIPWTQIIVLILLAAIFWAAWVRWQRFWGNRVDPVLESAGDRLDDGRHGLKKLFGSKA